MPMTKTINGIKIKGKIGQFFCKHKNTKWFAEPTSGFQVISGEKRVEICMDCSKEISSCFAEYEGSGFR